MAQIQTLEERLRHAVKEVEQSQAKWKVALEDRRGELGRLDARVQELNSQIEDLESTVRISNEQQQQTNNELASVREQVASTEADLRKAKAEEASITRTHENELNLLRDHEARLKHAKTELATSQGAQAERESTLDSTFGTSQPSMLDPNTPHDLSS